MVEETHPAGPRHLDGNPLPEPRPCHVLDHRITSVLQITGPRHLDGNPLPASRPCLVLDHRITSVLQIQVLRNTAVLIRPCAPLI